MAKPLIKSLLTLPHSFWSRSRLFEGRLSRAPAADIYRVMLTDSKKYGLSVNLMATRVMPSLLPLTLNAALHLDQFTSLIEVLQEMLDTIDR